MQKVGLEVLVQRMDIDNIQLPICILIYVTSGSKFQREQHPRHGFWVLVPCLDEVLGAERPPEKLSGCGELRELAWSW